MGVGCLGYEGGVAVCVVATEGGVAGPKGGDRAPSRL